MDKPNNKTCWDHLIQVFDRRIQATKRAALSAVCGLFLVTGGGCIATVYHGGDDAMFDLAFPQTTAGRSASTNYAIFEEIRRYTFDADGNVQTAQLRRAALRLDSRTELHFETPIMTTLALINGHSSRLFYQDECRFTIFAPHCLATTIYPEGRMNCPHTWGLPETFFPARLTTTDAHCSFGECNCAEACLMPKNIHTYPVRYPLELPAVGSDFTFLALGSSGTSQEMAALQKHLDCAGVFSIQVHSMADAIANRKLDGTEQPARLCAAAAIECEAAALGSSRDTSQAKASATSQKTFLADRQVITQWAAAVPAHRR